MLFYIVDIPYVKNVIQEKFNVVNLVDGKWRLNTMGCILYLLNFYYSFLIVLMFSRKERTFQRISTKRRTRRDLKLEPEADPS